MNKIQLVPFWNILRLMVKHIKRSFTILMLLFLLAIIEDKQAEQQEQLDFFIRTSIPPAEMVFFEGDFYTARVAFFSFV